MKLYALYDSKGTILAAVEVVDGYGGPVPVATEPDHRTDTLEIPEVHRSKAFDEICKTLRVEGDEQKRLVER